MPETAQNHKDSSSKEICTSPATNQEATVVPKPKPTRKTHKITYIRCQCKCSKGKERHGTLSDMIQRAPDDKGRWICAGCHDRFRMNMGHCG